MALSRDDVIAIAARINSFVKDEIIVSVFANLDKEFYEDFTKSKTDDERRAAWACAKAMDRFKEALGALVEAGTMAQKEIEREDRAAAMSRTRGPRPAR
jgi:hypothetical protein